MIYYIYMYMLLYDMIYVTTTNAKHNKSKEKRDYTRCYKSSL